MRVVAVSARKGHRLSKDPQLAIRLIAGQGVEGDAHCGINVKHRSRARFNPDLPNLRQVHLIHHELLDELADKGLSIAPGELGENIMTIGIDLLALPTDAMLHIGKAACLRLTGLRNPCIQLERHKPGLMEATLDRAPDGTLVRKAGVMAVVEQGGEIYPGDLIRVSMPPGLPSPLVPV